MDTAAASNQVNIRVTAWNACYNAGEGIISLSCTATANGGGISGIGLMLNNPAGETLASIYVELSGDCTSVTPAINLPPGKPPANAPNAWVLKVGESINGVVSGEADGQHFFFQEALTIENC